MSESSHYRERTSTKTSKNGEKKIKKEKEHLRLSTQLGKKKYDRPLDDNCIDDITGWMTSLKVKTPDSNNTRLQKCWPPTGTWNASEARICPKFTPLFGVDEECVGEMKNVITTRLQCITSMNRYENMSLEELRLGDHMAGFRYKGFPSGTSLFKESKQKEGLDVNWSSIGTKIIKFHPLEDVDEECDSGMTHTTVTNHQCITSMSGYEKKSLEELRVEDYMAGLNFINAFGFGRPVTSYWSEDLPDYLMPSRNDVLEEFRPTPGSDSLVRAGVLHEISTRHQCITAMLEFETISSEELRLRDYLSGSRGPTGPKYQASKEELKNVKIQHDMSVYIIINTDGNEMREKGKVKFIGRTPKKAFGKLHAGIDLKREVGDSDGLHQGVRLFRTKPDHAKFVPLTEVFPIEIFDEFHTDDSDSEKDEEDSNTITEPEPKNCAVCLINPVEIHFSPCGHVRCCDVCSKRLTKCPICRAPIQSKTKAYL